MGEQQDVIEILVTDHREVEDMFARLERLAATGGDAGEAGLLAEKVVIELVRHSVAEEEYLYPAVRKHVPGGDETADHEIQEHAEAEETMKRLERLEPGDADFWPAVHRLIEQIRHHLDEEENDLFPRLRQSCSHERLVELGTKIQRAKRLAPTRPHPSAPDTPPGNRLLAPGTALVDRVRDALSGRGRP
ncbi:hemerythrin domain-containing protein [Nonomuraea sp. NPDC050643]|uniref:hemerythrin domain-containing protein n=1 Tax=Nonomuraea sp. NPDC050643 TaxID=3155660 RepID=UPI0033D0BAAD